jgi:uncharacterized protein (TIGR03118 family)
MYLTVKFQDAIALSIVLIVGSGSGAFGAAVFQQNLVSDIPGLAAVTDPNLKNPWGVSFSPTSPFWVSDQATAVATLYNASGAPQGGPLIVSTPGGATGQVFNPTTSFQIPTPTPAASTFIFATLAGNIEAWNGAQGTTAAIMQTVAGASYTGLTMATLNGSPTLYAANKGTGKIDVFDSSFNPLTLPGTPFADASVPAGLTPYNIQVIAGTLYVEYSGARGAPGGFVAQFDTSGNLIRNISDPHLNAPWGIVMAPAGFDGFGGDLLIGNFNDGTINAFNPLTGTYIGTLTDAGGNVIANPGLWALEFRDTSSPNGNTGTDPNALYFTAGINNEADGLFARISAVPEPGTFVLAGTVLLAALSYRFLALRKL